MNANVLEAGKVLACLMAGVVALFGLLMFFVLGPRAEVEDEMRDGLDGVFVPPVQR